MTESVRVDLTEAQRLTELDERIEAAAKALYADNRSQWDSPEFEWLHPDMQSRYRAVVAKVIAVAGLPGLIGELTEARQQLETAQQRADQAEAVIAAGRELAERDVKMFDDVDSSYGDGFTDAYKRMLLWVFDRAALGAAVNDSSTEATQ